MMESRSCFDLDNPFWRFSLRVYDIAEVAKECLELQRTDAININMLLFCAWMAASHRTALIISEVRSIESNIRHWHETTVLPLRKVREQLKSASGIQHQAVQAFRHQVLATELSAEQIEQALLFEQAKQLPPRHDDGAVRDIIVRNVSKLMRTGEIGGSISALISASLSAARAV